MGVVSVSLGGKIEIRGGELQSQDMKKCSFIYFFIFFAAMDNLMEQI